MSHPLARRTAWLGLFTGLLVSSLAVSYSWAQPAAEIQAADDDEPLVPLPDTSLIDRWFSGDKPDQDKWRQQPAQRVPINRTESTTRPLEDLVPEAVSPRYIFEALKKPQRDTRREHLGLYLMDLESGEVVAVADEQEGPFTYYGSPQFSPDGDKIVYDATPGNSWSRSRIKLLTIAGAQLLTRDLGPGNCPAFSPDGRAIAFLLNPGTDYDGDPGVWIMNADGSRRQRLANGSVPKWSPGGKRILNASFSSPVHVHMLDANDGDRHPINLPDHRVYSIPIWVDAETVVALVLSDKKEQIALIDVSNPSRARIVNTLLRTDNPKWKKKVAYPVYSAESNTCVFVFRDDNGQSLYRFEGDEEPEPIRSGGTAEKIAALSLSPDGQYLLFCSNGNPTTIEKEVDEDEDDERRFDIIDGTDFTPN